jgi:hypothetical protein
MWLYYVLGKAWRILFAGFCLTCGYLRGFADAIPQVCNVAITDMLMSGSLEFNVAHLSLRDRDRLTLVNPWNIKIMKL